jgi:hypothetical protein
MRLTFAVVLTVFTASYGLGGCKPKPGGSCKESGHAQCTGAAAALVCEDGTWHELQCRGKAGCAELSHQVKCDQDQAHVGDICLDEESSTCSADKKQTLKCKNKKFVLDENCLGPKGCTSTSVLVECDNSLAQVGDPCSHGSACSIDGKSLLKCLPDKWVVDHACKNGCTVSGNTLNCN